MAECRYFPECQRCNEVGDSWLPCAGGSDGIRCKGYEPMPDMKALLSMADEMEEFAQDLDEHFDTCEPAEIFDWLRRIRKACGEEGR